jgi:hypothetical protein
MMEGFVKHTGILTNTGKNVVVVFMSLPGDPEHCLVVDTDALPDTFNHSLRKVVESIEAQQSKDLADVLARTMSPDGSNTTLLQKFHMSQRLQKVPVDIVTMTPKRGVNWPLKDILAAMSQAKEQKEAEVADLSDLDPETRAQVSAEIGKFNVHAQNMDTQSAEAAADQARQLIVGAELLEAEAANKRAQAYRLDPSLLKPRAKVAKVEAPAVPTIDTTMPTVSKPKAPPRRRAR